MGWIIYFATVIVFYGLFIGYLTNDEEISGPMFIAAVISALIWPIIVLGSIGYGASKRQ